MELDERDPDAPTAPTATDGHPGTANPVEWSREYVYGTISTLVAISGLTFEKRPDSVSAGGIIIVGAFAIALAHAVSHLVVDWSQQSEARPFTLRTVAVQLRRSWPIVSAALPATVVLSISRSGLFSTTAALTIDQVVGVGALAVVGIMTAREPSHSFWRRAAYVVSLVTVGVLIVALEVVTHHL